MEQKETSARGGLDLSTGKAAGEVYDLLDPPVWLVTSANADSRGGLIATFAARASIVPSLPRMVLGVAKQHHTWGLIEASDRFALHLLFPDQTDLIRRFGSRSGHGVDKFRGLPDERTPGGCPLLTGALAWLDCRVENRMDTGDRTLYLAAVEAGGTSGGSRPLTVRQLFAKAPEDLRQRLDELYARDGQVDAEAILRWRAAHPDPGLR
jgi:flavin reductase (DIM6/NTAB) family NADH-FMN oxidoreductase RutF